jgi:hypothetical protein
MMKKLAFVLTSIHFGGKKNKNIKKIKIWNIEYKEKLEKRKT